MLVSSFNLSQSFNYTPYLFSKKWFKSEINSFCIWTQFPCTVVFLPFPSNPSFSKKVNNAIWKVPHYFLKKLIHIDECCYFWKLYFLRTIFCRIFYDFCCSFNFPYEIFYLCFAGFWSLSPVSMQKIQKSAVSKNVKKFSF